jgi:hypothetical protein
LAFFFAHIRLDVLGASRRFHYDPRLWDRPTILCGSRLAVHIYSYKHSPKAQQVYILCDLSDTLAPDFYIPDRLQGMI